MEMSSNLTFREVKIGEELKKIKRYRKFFLEYVENNLTKYQIY